MRSHTSGRSRALALLAAVLLLSSSAEAKDERVAERLLLVEQEVEQITGRIERLEAQVAPGRGFITEQDAVERYQDYVYLHLIGEHSLAAEGFFTLVTTAALGDVGLHRDAEWYLAESLFEMGNWTTAEARYLVIADDDQHPFREDAVRRLLELYAQTGQVDQFTAVYEKEILDGRVTPNDAIIYSLAKSFYHQGRHAEAVEHFQRVQAGSSQWGKARYFLGTLAVLRKDLPTAAAHFREVADLAVNTTEDRQVRDLALLALGRIAYEQGDLAQAADWYSSVGGDSQYLADKLYEIVWTFIQQEQFRAALDGVEIFLLRFPEHEYTAQLKLLEGHLRLEQSEYQSALGAYEGVVADYTPIQKRVGELGEQAAPIEHFKQILSSTEGEGAGPEGLPKYAVAMMVSDDQLDKALSIYGDIVEQQEQVAESEAIISELRGVLDSAAGIGGYERLRYSILLNQGGSTDAQLALLELEEQWLLEHGGPPMRDRLEPLQSERLALVGFVESVGEDFATEQAIEAREAHILALTQLQDRIEALKEQAGALHVQLDGGTLPEAERPAAEEELTALEADLEATRSELDDLRVAGPSTEWDQELATREAEVASRLTKLRRRYRELRGQVTANEGDLFLARLDGLHTLLESHQVRLVDLRAKLASMEATELGRIRARFDHEVEEVARQRQELKDTMAEAEVVSAELTRRGFGRLEDFFAESVLRADMGIVDVFWSQKLEVSDERERMAEEKATLLTDLEQRFDVIRQKLE